MQTKLNIIIGIFLMAIVYSCEKTIEFEGKNMEPKIVVHGNLLEGYPVRALVFKSRSLLSDEEFYNSLPNAVVKLYEDDVYTETLEYAGRVDTFRKQLPYDVIKEYIFTNGAYSGKTVVKAGKTYRLDITCDGFESITCKTTIPEPVEITKFDTITEVSETENGLVVSSWIYIHFHDPGGIQNYYMLQSDRIYGKLLNDYDRYSDQPFVPSDTILVRSDSYSNLELTDPIFNNINQADDIIMGSPDNRFGIFTDSQIDGKDYILSVLNGNPYFANGGYNPYQGGGGGNGYNVGSGAEYGVFNSLNIKLVSITKEYYDYLNTANYHFYYSDDPFSEPVPVASNVIGGMGIWSASSVSVINVTHGTYPMPGKTYINEYEYYNRY
jgi:hypothetical protein